VHASAISAAPDAPRAQSLAVKFSGTLPASATLEGHVKHNSRGIVAYNASKPAARTSRMQFDLANA
jgi:hypothetical protein